MPASAKAVGPAYHWWRDVFALSIRFPAQYWRDVQYESAIALTNHSGTRIDFVIMHPLVR
jgi:hypothetical protein